MENHLPLKVLVVALLAAGCAAATAPGNDAFRAGNYARAAELYGQCAREGDPACMHNLGYMYESGRISHANARNLAVGWYTLAARHGQAESRAALVNMGAPVPSADLVRDPSQAELDAAASVGGLVGQALGGALRRR